jgi:HEAT repeat protein
MDEPTTIKDWLGVGDLRSDGLASQVAVLVNENPDLLPDLLEALANGSDTVRGHAADALERVSRLHPAWIASSLDQLLSQATSDSVPMVRWHMAMLFGNLGTAGFYDERLTRALVVLLDDCSNFVKSWAISSLCLIGRLVPQSSALILESIAPLQEDASIAVRHRAHKAVELLMNLNQQPPPGWVKVK